MRAGGRGLTRAGLPLLAVMTACAGHFPPCPAAGGPVWTELEGTHFRLRTDASPAEARIALNDLEQLEAALLTVFGAPPDLDTGKIPAVVVDRGWTDFAPYRVQGYFTYALFQPLVVMVSGNEVHRQEVIKHELAHFLSGKVIARQPLWLSEGLATYYQTIEYDAAAGRVTVGRPPPDLLRNAQRMGVSNISGIFAATDMGEDPGLFYASAWITIHYLMNHRAVALASYERALRGGSDPAAAWTSAFGAQTPDALASDIHRHLDGGQYALLIYRLPAQKLAAPVERRLSDADTHATRALLYLTGGRIRTGVPDHEARVRESRAQAQREVDEASRQESDHVRTLAIAHWMLGAPVDFERTAVATRKYPGDWLAWLLLTDAHEARNDRAGWDDAVQHVTELARADRSVTIRGRSSPHP